MIVLLNFWLLYILLINLLIKKKTINYKFIKKNFNNLFNLIYLNIKNQKSIQQKKINKNLYLFILVTTATNCKDRRTYIPNNYITI